MLPEFISWDLMLKYKAIAEGVIVWTLTGLSSCYSWEKAFWGWFLIIGDTAVLILWPGKQTADKDIRGMQRHGGNHCCTVCGKWTTPLARFIQASSVSPTVVDEYVLSRCHLYVYMRAPRHHLCVDITPSPVLYSDCCLSPAGRTRRAGATMVNLAFRRGNWAFSLYEHLASLIILQGRLHKRNSTI